MLFALVKKDIGALFSRALMLLFEIRSRISIVRILLCVFGVVTSPIFMALDIEISFLEKQPILPDGPSINNYDHSWEKFSVFVFTISLCIFKIDQNKVCTLAYFVSNSFSYFRNTYVPSTHVQKYASYYPASIKEKITFEKFFHTLNFSSLTKAYSLFSVMLYVFPSRRWERVDNLK